MPGAPAFTPAQLRVETPIARRAAGGWPPPYRAAKGVPRISAGAQGGLQIIRCKPTRQTGHIRRRRASVDQPCGTSIFSACEMDIYVGSTNNLSLRFETHVKGRVVSTRDLLPARLISETAAQKMICGLRAIARMKVLRSGSVRGLKRAYSLLSNSTRYSTTDRHRI